MLDEIRCDPFFGAFFYQTPIASAITGANHQILMVNNELCRMLGYSEAELLQLDTFEISHPEDHDKTKDISTRLRVQNQTITTLKRYLCKDGSIIWANLSVFPLILKEENTGLFIVQLHNMTDNVLALQNLKEHQEELNQNVLARTMELEKANGLLTDEIEARALAQQELRRSEAQYRQVIEKQTEMVCQFKPDSTLTFVNHAYARFLGKEPSDITGERFLEFLPEEEHEKVLKAFRSAKKIGDSFTLEREALGTDGQLYWQHWTNQLIEIENGEPKLYQGIGRDITEKVRSDLKRNESEEHLKFALEGSETDWFVWNPEMDEISSAPWWLEKLGYDAKYAKRRFSDWKNYLHQDDIPRMNQAVDDLFKRKSEMLSIEYRVRNAANQYRWIYTRAKVKSWEGDRAVKIIGTSVDITKRRQAQAQLLAAKNAAEVAAQTKTHFLANISHEIRTPLNGILGTADWLLNLPTLPEKITDGISIIRESSTGLLRLINDILDFSRLEDDQLDLVPSAFQPIKLMGEVRDLFEAITRERDQRFKVEPDNRLPDWLFGDGYRLRQVLINILGNAIKFTPDGGSITLTSRLIEIGGTSVRVRFETKDTGIGIPKEKQAEIFNRFTQADPSTTRTFGGTGLGLAISAHLVELMGGSIHVESEPGKGSIFSFDVCLDRFKPPVVSPEKEQEQSIPRIAPKKILVVEDNPVNQKVIRRLLESANHQVSLASDGQAALDILENHSFDLVFLDIQMPGMDGFETIRRIRKRETNSGQHQTVIALTAMAMHEDRARCIAAGMDDYLAKPIRRGDLLRKLADLTD